MMIDNVSYDNYLVDKILLPGAKLIDKDWDMVFLVDGKERVGKSVFAQQLAFYFDRTLNLDRIVFTPEQFTQAIRNAKKYNAIIYDESYGGLSSKSAMSKINKLIVKVLTEIGQKNLILFIIMPTFFDMDKYVAIWRSVGLFHVYYRRGIDKNSSPRERGLWCYFNEPAKKDLYLRGKDRYDYSFPRSSLKGGFANKYIVDEQEYRKKKLASTIETDSEDNIRIKLTHKVKEMKKTLAENIMKPKLGLTQKQIAEIMGITTMTLNNYSRENGLEEEKIPEIELN